MKTRSLTLAAALILAGSGLPAAAAGWATSPLGRARFGEVWNGKPLKQEDLAGRVVLVKTWADG